MKKGPRSKEAKTLCLHISINARTGVEIVMSSDKKYPDLASIRFRILSVFKNSHPGERIKKVADSFAGFAGYVWTEAESAKKKLRIQKYPGYVVDVAQEYYSPTTYRAGAAVASTTRVIFSYTFRVIFYIRFQACFACLSSEGFNKPFFYYYSSLHFNDLRSMKPN